MAPTDDGTNDPASLRYLEAFSRTHHGSEPPRDILRACEEGNIKVVMGYARQAEFGHHCNVLLCVASSAGQTATAMALLREGAHASASFDAPIISAAGNNDSALVRELLKLGADLCAREGSPLVAAASNGHQDMVTLLISMGANANENFEKALVEAAGRGHLEVVKRLVHAQKANVTARNHGALIKASAGGHEEIVVFLLEEGCDDSTWTLSRAIREASLNGHSELVALLEGRGASWEQVFEHDHLIKETLGEGPIEALRWAFHRNRLDGALISKVLLAASAKGRLDIVAFLLDRTAVDGTTIAEGVKCATEKGHIAIVKVLLASPACKLQDDDYDDLLVTSMRTPSAELSAIFRERGGSPLNNDLVEMTLCCTARSGSVERMQQLAQEGLQIDPSMQSVLYSAFESGNAQMVAFVLASGAKVEKDDVHIYFQRAVTSSSTRLLQLLIELEPSHAVDYRACLYSAASNNAMDMLHLVTNKDHIQHTLPHIDDAIVSAAGSGHVEVIRYLASIKGDAIAKHQAAFLEALTHGHVEVARFLLVYGRRVHFYALLDVLPRGQQHQLLGYNHLLDSLLALACDVPIDLSSMLVYFAEGSSAHLMQVILSYIPPEKRSEALTATLIAASLSPYFAVSNCYFLIDSGADPKARHSQAALNAIATGSLDVFDVLTCHGVRIQARSKEEALAAIQGLCVSGDRLALLMEALDPATD